MQEKAIMDADLFLASSYGAVRLVEADFATGAVGRFRAGWSLLIQPSNRERRLHMYADASFPFSRPTFFLLDRPELLTWPHIEENGKLCLLDDVIIERPELTHEVLRSEVTDAFRLVEQSESGTNRPDFQREFHSYWNRQANLSGNRVYSLLKTRGPSRLIRLWRGKNWSVAAETEEEIALWLKHRHGTNPDYEHSDPACLLWLSAPLMPDEYPHSGANLYNLAKRTPEGDALLGKLALLGGAPFPVIFGTDTENGPCFAAVYSYGPKRLHARGASGSKTRPGFRPGKVPPDLQTQHLFSTTARVEPLAVDRVDASWVHGRGHDVRQKTLANKHVVIAGCGSVGAPIAQHLAMAGVGRLTNVDPDDLSWSNIGRYPLGSKFVGLPKARAISEFLQENLPHLRIDGFVGKIEDFLAKNTDPPPALIIVATADWSCERILNLRHIDGQIICPLLFTWTEPHACAGHAVYLPSTKPCLQCGFTRGGDLRRPVTTWPAHMPSHLSEPACGAHFQPYGPIELMGTIAVAASLALDALLGKLDCATQRVWAGSKALLEENGGAWSDTWIAGHSNRVTGSLQEILIWEQDPNCNACGQGRGASFSTSASLVSKL
jgi:sulfur-carrier protein adenylyltransferase/sulfurtransferase